MSPKEYFESRPFPEQECIKYEGDGVLQSLFMFEKNEIEFNLMKDNDNQYYIVVGNGERNDIIKLTILEFIYFDTVNELTEQLKKIAGLF